MAPPREYSFTYGIAQGFKHFLPLFEFQNITSIFRPLSIITFFIFLLRITSPEYYGTIILSVIVYFIIAFTVNIFFAYTRYIIIFEGEKAFEAMGRSIKMTLDNLDITFHIYFTLLFVYVRTIITVVIFVIFPFLISAVITYFTTFIFKIISVVVIFLILAVLLFFVSHLNSVLEIFVDAIWYLAYKDNVSRNPPEKKK